MNADILERLKLLIEGKKGKKRSDENQSALAEAIGVPPATLSGWLKKGRSIPAERIIAICEFYGVSPAWLLTGKEVPGVSGLSEQEVSLLGLFRDLPDDAHRDMVYKQVRAAVDALSGSACCAAPERGEKKEESPASSRGKAI